MKPFFYAVARLALALFLAGVALSLAVAAYAWATSAYERHEAKPFETLKEWSADLRENIGVRLTAKTKVVDGKLLLSVDIQGYPPSLTDPRLSERNQKAQLLIHFLDSDGFQVFSKPIKIPEFSSIVGTNGEKIGLRTQEQSYLALSDYKRFQRIQVEWTLETSAPPAPSTDSKVEPTALDHCAPSLSRAERLRRLSKHGELRETGLGSFSAGSRSVHFLSDRELLSCQ